MNGRKVLINGIFIIVFIVLGFVLMNLFKGMKAVPHAKEKQESTLYVKAKPVVYDTQEVLLDAKGRIVAGNKVSLGAQMQGELLAGDVDLREGVSFRKGQVLARIFSDNAEFNLKAQKSRFMNSIAGVLPDIKIDFPTQYQNYLNFFHALDVNKKIADLPNTFSNKEKVFLAGRNILTDYYSIKSQEVQMGKYVLYAPFDGAFTKVNMEVGSMVNPGAQIASMIHTSNLELAVPISPVNISLVNKGDNVRVYAEGNAMEIKGKVDRIAEYLDEASQSILVFITLDNNTKSKIFQGQYFKVQLQAQEIDSCMMVPRNALINQQKVYFVKDSLLGIQDVEVLHVTGTEAMIRGIEEGTQIVVEPLVNARLGSKTKVIDGDF